MNPYGYNSYGTEPVVPPPRRKRSLSNSRITESYYSNYGAANDSIDQFRFAGGNRMKQRNFSTDHIPNSMYSDMQKPLSSAYHISPQYQAQYQAQQQSQRLRQSYGSSGNLVSTTASGLMCRGFGGAGVPGAAMQVPRFMNPMASPPLSPQSSQQATFFSSRVPIRPHQDYLKYAQNANLQYNPYSANFCPALMARPSIESFPSGNVSGPGGSRAAGRDSATHYGSKEQVNSIAAQRNQRHMGEKPERPPPPKYSSNSNNNNNNNSTRLSIENLNAEIEIELAGRSQFRDRRSVSPSRLGAYPNPLQPQHQQQQQQSYNVRRSTSPLPGMYPTGNRSPEMQSLSRSGSRNSLNQSPHSPSPLPSQSYYHTSSTGGRFSRESSPLRSPRSPSPLHQHRVTSPFSFVARPMDTLQVPGEGNLQDVNFDPLTTSQSNANMSLDDSQSRQQQQQQQSNQFANIFTDHCDQYKSLTSKILGKKVIGNNRKSGDFTEFTDTEMAANQNSEMENNARFDSDHMRQSPQRQTPLNLPNMEDDYHHSNEYAERNGNILMAPTCDEGSDFDNASSIINHRDDRVNSTAIMQRRNTNIDPLGDVQTSGLAVRRRRSSANGSQGHGARKGSLPTDYIANANSLPLSAEWTRERVANMAHEARQRAQNHRSGAANTLRNIGHWCTRQIALLVLASINVLLAYVFYHLLVMLPGE